MKLYEIAEYLETAIEGGYVLDEETGEVLFDAENLDELQVALDEKLEACGVYVKGLLAEAEAIKAEEAILAKRRKTAERKANWMKVYINSCMELSNKEKLSTPKVQLSFRRSKAVEIVDETKIPDTLCVSTITMKPDKSAIKRAIEHGESVPGAALVERENLVIK